MNYYVSGFQVSDELYHHGILGQKWGVRRYQNADGSYTTLGRVRYGVGKAGKAVGSAISEAAKATGRGIKKAAEHKVDKVKRNHPWMMSDDELRAQTERMRLENSYLSEVNKKRDATMSRGQKLARDILETSAKTLAVKAVDSAAKKLFENKEKPVRDLEDVLNDSMATASEIKSAYDRFKNQQELEKVKSAKEMRDYKPTDDVLDRVDSMSKGELDNYNAWRSSRYGKEKGSIEKALSDREKDRKNEETRQEAEKAKQEAEIKQRIKEDEDREAAIRQRIQNNIDQEHRLRDEGKGRFTGNEASQKKEQAAINFVNSLFEASSSGNYKTYPEYEEAIKRAKRLVANNEDVNLSTLFPH